MAIIKEVKVKFTGENKMTSALNNMMNGMNAYNSRMLSIDNSLKRINQTTNGYLGTLTKLSSAYKAVGTLVNAFNGAFSGFFDYYKSFQTNAVGISGILSSMVTLNGKTLEWNQSMSISKDIMSRLRIQALQTAATSEDLIETFRALLGPGLASKMSIDEIMKFTTVGVNAVKSLGLPTNQLIQELRDLVQGGIRAASSTLATALGLTDADINAAKQSSEGLFKFLMKRMEGFARSTDETANTIYGQMEIAKEAIKSIGASAGEDLFSGFGEALKKINSILLTRNGESGLLEVNPEVVANVKNVADYLNTAVKFAADLGATIYDNFNILKWGAIIAYGVPKAFEMGLSVVQSFSNKISNAIEQVKTFKNVSVEAQENFQAEAQASISKLQQEQRIEEEITRLKKEQAKVLEATNKIISKREPVMFAWDTPKTFSGEAIEKAVKEYQKLGYSEKEARDRMLDFLRAMQSTDPQIRAHAQQIYDEAMKLAKNSEEVAKNISWKQKLLGVVSNSISVLGSFSGVLSSVAFGLSVVADEDNKFIKGLSSTLFAVDAVITGLDGLNGALKACASWWNGLSIAARTATLTMLTAVPIAMAAGAMIYSASKGGGSTNTETGDGNDISDMLNFNSDGTVKSVKSNQEIMNAADIAERIQGDAELQKWIRLSKQNLDNANNAQKTDYSTGFSTKFTPGEKDKKGSSSSGKSEAEKAADALEKAVKKYESLQDKLDVDIKKSSLMYSALDEKNAEILKQENAWAEEIKALAEKGLEETKIKELTALKDKAIDERRITAKREFNKKMMDLNLDAAQNIMLLGGSQGDQYTAVNKALQAEKAYYDGLLQIEGLAVDKRIELEKERANIVKQIRDNDMLNYKTAWKATLQELATQQINYGDSIKGVFSSIESAGASLLSSTESFGVKIKTFFSDVASSILSEMAKIIMKGLITNAILSVFGMGRNSGVGSIKDANGFTTKLANSNFSNIISGMSVKDIPLTGFHAATGGLHSGWGIVGEQGPELVNFSQPGRVYTAQQTANALGGGNVNIKIDLRNESGQQLEAESTGSSFDGESYVVGVVLKAISTNKGGLRTVLRGV